MRKCCVSPIKKLKMWIALTLLHKDPGTVIAMDTEAMALWDEEVVNPKPHLGRKIEEAERQCSSH